MARRRVPVDGGHAVLNVDELPLAADWLWSVLQAHVRDELSGEVPETPIAVASARADLAGRAGPAGLVGLTTVPRRSLSTLETTPASLRISIRAPGYVPFDERITIGPQAGFPDRVVPRSLGTVALHREPTVVLGRVVLDDVARTPVPHAAVELIGIWRSEQAVAAALPPDPPDLVSLPARLYAGRSAGGRLRARGVSPVLGDDKTLQRTASAGETALRLSNVSNVTPGAVVLVEPLDPGRAEYLPVSAVRPGASVFEPGTVIVAHPLAWLHRVGATVRRTTLQAPGTTNTFDAGGMRGDACVLLQASVGLAGATTVEIFGGGPPSPEYHPLRRFEVSSDGSGFFRFPPISRVAQMRVRGRNGLLVGVVDVRPDYPQPETVVDVVLQ